MIARALAVSGWSLLALLCFGTLCPAAQSNHSNQALASASNAGGSRNIQTQQSPKSGQSAPGGSDQNSVPPAGTGPTSSQAVSTNVSASPTTNVQNPTTPLVSFDASKFPTLSASAGSLSWDGPKTLALVQKACAASHISAPSFKDSSTYALINILNLNTKSNQTTVNSSNWYIYSQQRHWYRGWIHGWTLSDFDGSTRFYGASHIVLVPIVVHVPPGDNPDISYKFTITKQQASNIANVYSLLGAVFPAPKATPLFRPKARPYRWSCSEIPIAYKTSSIKADTTLSSYGGSGPFTSSLTFTNEPKEWWDVSFALPITKVSALQYSSTNGTLTASQINKQSLFAVVDLYVPPTNLSVTGYDLIPHPFVGVAMNSQPLHSLLFGLAVGLHLAQVYAGATLVKQQQLSANGTVSYGYKPAFSMGIKISIRTAINAFTSSKSK